MQPASSNLTALITSKRQKPICRIKVFDTSKSVPSKGFQASFFTLENNTAMINGGNDWFGTSPDWIPATDIERVYPTDKDDLPNVIEPSTCINFDWGIGGSPITIGQPDLFAIKYEGYFFARYPGTYRFYLDTPTHARIRIKFDGSYLTLNDDSGVVSNWTNTDPGDGNKKELYADTATLTSGTWYSIQIEYWVIRSPIPPKDPTYLCVKYREPSGATTTYDEFGRSGAVSHSATFDVDNGSGKGTITADSGTPYNGIHAGDVMTITGTADNNGTYMVDSVSGGNVITTTGVINGADGVEATTVIDIGVVTNYQSDYQDADGNDIKKVLSAGIVNTTGAFLTGTELTQVISLKGNKDVDQASEYEFELPIPNATQLAADSVAGTNSVTVDSTDGLPSEGFAAIGSDEFTYTGKTATSLTGINDGGKTLSSNHSNGDVVHLKGAGDYPYNPDDNSFGVLRPFKLVSIEIGYQDFSGTPVDYYQNRIWGYICSNPTIGRNKDGTDVLRVKIQDFKDMLMQVYNRNWPDYASYSGAGYYKDYLLGEPNGVTRPVAYDRWQLDKAMRDILMKANIDPVLLYGRQRKNITGSTPPDDFEKDYGEYLLRGKTQLDSNKNYGRPMTAQEGLADDAYNWFFGYGSPQIEGAMELARNFAYQFGFDSNGFAFLRPVNLPSDTYDNTSGSLNYTYPTGSSKTDKTDDLDCYKATYTELVNTSASPTVELVDFVGEDLSIIFRPIGTGTNKIKIQVRAGGGAVQAGDPYLDKLLWNGSTIVAVSDEFDLSYTATWAYYDGVASDTGENPSIIQLNTISQLTNGYGKYSLKITVTAGTFNLDSIFVYKNSIRKTARDLTTAETGADGLKVEQDVEELRNDVTVVGARQGKFQSPDGQVVNPNNPIFINTYARAVDTNSIYKSDDNNYVGRQIPFEVYNTKILDKPRADHIAINALKKYRRPETMGVFSMVGDPRLEPFDALGFQEKKLNVIPSGSKIWMESLSEEISKGKYLTRVRSATPREPMPSYQAKPEPVLSDFNNEPLLNIKLQSNGKRIAGKDGKWNSGSSRFEVSTDPGWTDDLWNGYYLYDKDGNEFKITDTVAYSDPTPAYLTIESGTPSNSSDNLWSISFDPFDTDQKGSPLEIHYDQIINATVQIKIVDANNDIIVKVNESTWNEIQEWGSEKVVYWSGKIQYKAKRDMKGYYISSSSSNYVGPLRIVFDILPEDKSLGNFVIDSYKEGKTNIVINGANESTQSQFGAIRIYPKIVLQTPIIKVLSSGNTPNFSNVTGQGVVTAITNIDSTKDKISVKTLGGTWSQYWTTASGYKLSATAHIDKNNDTKIPWTFDIDDMVITGGDTADATVIKAPSSITSDATVIEVDEYVEIIGGGPGVGYLSHVDLFKTTDNDGAGLKLTFETVDIYYEKGTVYYNGSAITPDAIPTTSGIVNGVWHMKESGTTLGVSFLSIVGSTYTWLKNNFPLIDESHQHNPSKGLYAVYSTAKNKSYLPGSALVIRGDFRITYDLTVYRGQKKGASGSEWIEFGETPYAYEQNFFDSGTFVSLGDFSIHFNPETEGFTDMNGQTTLIHPEQNVGWLFVFDFTIRDRAGRIVNNALDGESFQYVALWQPKSTDPYTTALEARTYKPKMKFKGALHTKFTVWT